MNFENHYFVNCQFLHIWKYSILRKFSWVFWQLTTATINDLTTSIILIYLHFWSRFYIVILGMTFFSSDNLLFPISIGTVFPLFYLDFYSLYEFFFYAFILFYFDFYFIFVQIAIWSWISSKFFFYPQEKTLTILCWVYGRFIHSIQ